MNLPADIGNQALDAAAIDLAIGDIQEGTRPAQVLLRAYGQCLRQLLRGANWDFARKTSDLQLLADATGSTPDVGTNVIIPWIYEYGYPVDCMKARFIPWNTTNFEPGTPPGNITPPAPTAPLVTGGSPPYTGQRLIPTRFIVATDPNFPPDPATPADEMPQGQSPSSTTVICTNVQKAKLVYTALMIYPATWDAMFRAAFVSYLASEIAVPLAKDKKFGVSMQDRLIKIVKDKIREARMADGNEGFTSSDIPVGWMRARFTGGGRNTWSPGSEGGGPGFVWGANDMCSFADGTAY